MACLDAVHNMPRPRTREMPCLDGAGVRTITLPNAEYKGTVNAAGMMHGHGKLTFTETGDTYEGEFVNHKCHGYGFYKFNNNRWYESYDGMWADDKRHGQGVFKLSSGSTYVGEFVNNKKHGDFVFYDRGEIYDQKYEHGEKTCDNRRDKGDKGGGDVGAQGAKGGDAADDARAGDDDTATQHSSHIAPKDGDGAAADVMTATGNAQGSPAPAEESQHKPKRKPRKRGAGSQAAKNNKTKEHRGLERKEDEENGAVPFASVDDYRRSGNGALISGKGRTCLPDACVMAMRDYNGVDVHFQTARAAMPNKEKDPNIKQATEFFRTHNVALAPQSNCVNNELNLFRRDEGVYLFTSALEFEGEETKHCGVYCAEEPWTHEEKTGRGVLKDNQYQPVRIDSADRVSSNAAREAFASLWHVDKAKLQSVYKLV